jgi:hypothetical protein
MSSNLLERVLTRHEKDILTSMALSLKALRGGFEGRPVEEIYADAELYFRAQKTFLLKGDFQPLVDFADTIARRRAQEHFRLHELLRAALVFKKAVIPLLTEEGRESLDDLVTALLQVTRATDRFCVNMAQAFVHYAKGYLFQEPMEFPVWVADPSWDEWKES